MGARLRSWWQKIRQLPFMVAGILVVIFALTILAVAVIKFGWDWTGFTGGASIITITSTSKGITTAKELQPARTLWDWLGLLGVLTIPVVVGLGAAWFTTKQTQASEASNKQQHETELHIAVDKQREDQLQSYLDHMTDLLLNHNLRNSDSENEARNVARVRTLTTICQLDARRIDYVVSFLRESGLVMSASDTCVISFSNANLQNVDLHSVDLRGFDLSGANLSGARLTEANLYNTRLNGANLTKTKFCEEEIDSSTDPPKSRTLRANLTGTNMMDANLTEADLSGANLSNVNFSHADLTNAQLLGATFSGVYFNGAHHLTGVNLFGTKCDRNVQFAGNDMSHAFLRTANLSEISFHAVKLIEANMEKATFVATSFVKCNLEKANLREANLTRAIFMGASLKGADLSGATLNGANLSRSGVLPDNMNQAQHEANFCVTTVGFGEDCPGADLSKANLSKANLTRATLNDATLIEADLSLAHLSGTDFTGANLSRAILKDVIGISNEELEKQTKSLKGATMPDGSIHP